MLRGVVEGFYGKPSTGLQRDRLIRHLSVLPFPAYLYAPKNDPYHRLEWKKEYPAEHWEILAANIRSAEESGVRFIFGISPWGFSVDEAGFARDKALRAMDAGASDICILFDDIPDKATPFLAERQLEFSRDVLGSCTDHGYLCPSIYCIELMNLQNGEEYLDHWREHQSDDVSVLWTGDAVISRDIDLPSLVRGEELLGCKPVIWDNILADDYSLRRIFLAGIENRLPSGNGYLLNPSSCFPAALYGVQNMLRASGLSCDLPASISDNHVAWKLLSGFHHLPWCAGEDVDLLMKHIQESLEAGASRELIERLEGMLQLLGEFSEQMQYIEGGFDLMPYILDIRKLLSWWLKALILPTRQQRIDYLRYMIRERLPFDHPLACLTASAVSSECGER
jgi:hypothetical protein